MLAASENALLARLRGHRDIEPVIRTIETLPKVGIEELLKRYFTDAPAFYVVPGKFLVRDDAAIMQFTVAGVVRNVAGQEQARKGDGIDIGCDHLIILAIRALHGQRIGDCTWNVTSGEMVDDEVFDAAGISAVELTLMGTPIELSADYGEAELANLAENSPIGNFTHLYADIDSPADAGELEYLSWLAEPPVYNTQPDLQMDVQLPGANA